jgi:hypothetical protein
MVTILQRVGIFIKAELAIAGNTFEALRNIVDWKRNQTNIDGCLFSALNYEEHENSVKIGLSCLFLSFK